MYQAGSKGCQVSGTLGMVVEFCQGGSPMPQAVAPQPTQMLQSIYDLQLCAEHTLTQEAGACEVFNLHSSWLQQRLCAAPWYIKCCLLNTFLETFPNVDNSSGLNRSVTHL